MTKEDALKILRLPENATRQQIEESYRQLRLLFYPHCYGRPHGFSAQQTQEIFYQDVSGGYYKPPKGVQYQNFPLDGYEYAFVSYARICQAYEYLTAPENQNEFGVDPNTAYGYDVLHYGKRAADIREKVSFFACTKNIPVLLMYLATGLIGAMINKPGNLFSVLSDLAGIAYIALLGCAWITLPLDMLLVVPKRIVNGMKLGAGIGPWITRPITIAALGGLYGLGGVISLFLLPAMAMMDRGERYLPWIKNPGQGKAAGRERYEKTLENIRQLPGQCGDGRIHAGMIYVHNVLKEAAEQVRAAQKELEYTRLVSEADVERAGRWLNLEVKFIAWDIDSAQEDYSKALDECANAIEAKERKLKNASDIFYSLIRRVGANADDYLDAV